MADKRVDQLTSSTPTIDDLTVSFDNTDTTELKKTTWQAVRDLFKAYFDTIYQAVLVSGTNIKTVNGNSLLGSGDIVISGGGGVTDHGALTGLADDDHTQYTKADGTRAFTGKVSYSSHPTFSADTELVDKKYVDDSITAGGGYTDEQAQDAVGTILVDSGRIDFTYSDATPSITADIIDDSVTFSKIQNISTNRILGRSTAGTGDIEELNVTAIPALIGLGTSDSPQFAGVNVGHASDTTITRVSAGRIAVEGLNVVTTSSTDTLTNKRITQRVNQATSHTTSVTIDSDSYDEYDITAQAGALLFNNPSGTPTNCQKLMVRIKDNGTARALTYGAQFASGAATLPTTTTISKKLWIGFEWDSTDSKWYCLATGVQP